MVGLGCGGFAASWGASGVLGCFGGLGAFMGPDLRKSESSKPELSPVTGRRPREEANEATSDLIASMSSPSPPAGFFDFLLDLGLGFGSMDGYRGKESVSAAWSETIWRPVERTEIWLTAEAGTRWRPVEEIE